MRWPTMSLTFQLSQAVGDSHVSGFSAIANSRSASLRTTRRMVSLPSYDVASHSVTAPHPSLGDLHNPHPPTLGGPAGRGAWRRECTRPPWRPQYEAQRTARLPVNALVPRRQPIVSAGRTPTSAAP